MRFATPVIALGSVLIAALAGACRDEAQEPSQTHTLPAMTGALIETIEEFETRQDAKCYATATRLENSIYGTPLDDESRFLKIDLQKRVIRDVWEQGSAAAVKRGAAGVALPDIGDALEALVAFDADAEGNVGVALSDRTLVLNETDLAQYASVAYALRAILAVQQEQLWSAGDLLLPLEADAVDALREHLDVLTLAALSLADQAARRANDRQITPERLMQAWTEVAALPPEAKPRAVANRQTSPDHSTFRAVIDQKIESYAGYNEIEAESRAVLFLRNIESFYARYYVPPGGLTLPEHLGRAAEAFVARVLGLADASAAERGDHLLRARDVEAALQAVIPYRVDDLEDVTFFPRLDRDERVVLAAFDLDSFRDFGMHWRLLQVMFEMQRVVPRFELDPFATELIAEGLAQYAVLLLRAAGQIARDPQAGHPPFLLGRHLDAAAALIERRASAHGQRAQQPLVAEPLRSAAASSPASGNRKLMTDVTAASGIDFVHRTSEWLNRFRRDIPLVPPTFSGGGLAAGDVNGDGIDDLLYVGGLGNVLYRGDGQGGFSRDPLTTTLQFPGPDGLPGEARQPLIADFDNDGRRDILITYVNAPHRLLRNREDGVLEDVSRVAGLGGAGGVAGPAVAFDFDRDGLLDIYICALGDYLAGHEAGVTTSADSFPGQLPTLARDSENGLPNRLFRNLGGFRFAEVENSGTEDTGWCQAVTHTDFDGDGWADLVVANDFGRNRLLRNRTDGTFEDLSDSLGMTRSYHSMNVGVADLNSDRLPDLYISNINMFVRGARYVLPDASTTVKFEPEQMAAAQIIESNMLYLSASEDGVLLRYDSSDAAGRSNAAGWAWDAEFFDFDNDGDDDLYVANGANEYFIHLAVREVEGEYSFDWNMEPNLLYRNEGGVLKNVSAQSGVDFQGNSRSVVYLDYDDDGDLDLALNNFEGSARFFRNDLDDPNAHWIKIRLVGDPERGSNRDAIGARLIATTSTGRQIWREIRGGSGYLSMEPKTQHLGLGASDRVDLEIRWPGGRVEHYRGLTADRSWVIEEGRPL